MLSFTTYSIPETVNGDSAKTEKWLGLIVSQPLADQDIDLLQKISKALKADFDRDTFCFQYDSSKSLTLSNITSPGTKLLISFGVAPTSLGLQIDLPVPGIRMLESMTFIRTLTLDALATQAIAKKELWKSMQTFLEEQ